MRAVGVSLSCIALQWCAHSQCLKQLTRLSRLCWVVVNQLMCVAMGSGAVSVISKDLIRHHGAAWKEEIIFVLGTPGGTHLDWRQQSFTDPCQSLGGRMKRKSHYL